MNITKLDHFVLTVKDIKAAIRFYTEVLGMEAVQADGNGTTVQFGEYIIKFHHHGDEISPHATCPIPGSTDFCLITDIPLDRVINHVASCGIDIIAGPVPRLGAAGNILSIYLRDPDGNLIEISNKVKK
jgi:catechol 2,3-dioxygenase-like lactoylglutathione lyase family enzyme